MRTSFLATGLLVVLAACTSDIAARLEPLGYSALPPAARSPHLLGVTLPPGAPDDLLARLAEAGIHGSRRGDRLRISPHLHVGDHDMGLLCTALAGL
jgi:hypothetical protein